ncbi:hypothetical protein Aperf_G00000082012 [Anoplocephala perfoliata]
MPGVENLPSYGHYLSKLEVIGERSFKKMFESEITAPDALDLIDRLLVYDPSKRLSVQAALNHSFFKRTLPLEDKPEAANRKQFWEKKFSFKISQLHRKN